MERGRWSACAFGWAEAANLGGLLPCLFCYMALHAVMHTKSSFINSWATSEAGIHHRPVNAIRST
jgi:hypothetical protein